MIRLLCLICMVLGLAGCRSSGPTVNPFLGSATVPAQPTGSIGPGGNAVPYYPPNVIPGQPSSAPPADLYNGQQQWLPRTSGLENGNPGANFASTPANYHVTGDVVNLDASAGAARMYDPSVQPAGASQNLNISAPVTYPQSHESALRVPTDNGPLVTQRQMLPPVVQQAPLLSQSVANPTLPVSYNMQQGHTQTIQSPVHATTPATAWNNMAVQNSGVPATLVYGGAQPVPMTVTQQQMQPQAYLQPQPQPIAAATPVVYQVSGPTLANGPTLAYGPTLATTQPQAIRQMPAVEITDLPQTRTVTQRVAN